MRTCADITGTNDAVIAHTLKTGNGTTRHMLNQNHYRRRYTTTRRREHLTALDTHTWRHDRIFDDTTTRRVEAPTPSILLCQVDS